MSDPSAYENDLCERFIDNPRINPIDGKRLIYGKGPYIGYVALCRTYGYNVDNLLSEELTYEYNAGSRSPSRSRSPNRSPVRSVPLCQTTTRSAPFQSTEISPVRPMSTQSTVSGSMTRSPVRSIPLRSTEPDILPVRPIPIQSTRSNSIEIAPPITPQRSLSVRTSPLSVPVVTGPRLQAQYSERTEIVGDETFDPDPVTVPTKIQPPSIRTTVRGPYGTNGQIVNTTGVYTPPQETRYTTYDYPEHSVTRGSNGNVMNSNSVRPTYSSRTVKTGNAQFDPDPTTYVVEEQQSSFRDEVIGPYGPNGEMIRTTGVHKLPGQRRYVTTDIPNHEVITNDNDLY